MTLRKPGGSTDGPWLMRSSAKDGLKQIERRTATSADYARILQLLMEGVEEGVLVRSLFRESESPYPLQSISRGPYQLLQDGIEGFSLDGEPHTIRITESDLHNVEMRRGQGEWMAPEMGGIILLIAQ